jgi:hypothetical protein
VRSHDEIYQRVRELRREKHDYKTVVFDTLDGIEPLIISKWLEDHPKSDSPADDFYKGYADMAKGFKPNSKKSRQYWGLFVEAVETLVDDGMNVIMICHSKVKSTKDPEKGEYDRWQPKIDDRAWQFVTGISDFVFFAEHETHVISERGRGGKSITKTVSTDNRFIRTTFQASSVSKRRIQLPEQLPLEFAAFQAELDKFYESVS